MNQDQETNLGPAQLIDQAAPVRPGEELDAAALEQFLRANLPGPVGPLTIEQFPGGFSNLTYALRLGDREMVLRRAPFGANIKGGHDMHREYRILRALTDVYPKVPRPLLYTEDATIMGTPFYVMERVRGVILRPETGRLTPPPPDLMRRICLQLIDTLVELHRLDYSAAGLADLGHPEGFVARQVAGWTKRYGNAQTDPIEAVDQVARWLSEHLPSHSDAALIHNDYRYDNVILDPKDLTRIIAILDWEMATLGDPLTDVGTTLAYWAEPDDPPALRNFGLTTLAGNLDRQAFAEAYAARSGREITSILFYYVYGLFKNAVIVQQIYFRYRHGFTQDHRFAAMLDMVKVYSDMAVGAIDRGRISGLSR